MESLSHRINALSPSATVAMYQKTRDLQAQGIDVINLGVGEPDFNTPDHIKAAAKKGLSLNKGAARKCNNRIGVRRAVQLVNRAEVSTLTVKRMFSYLSRAKTYYQPNDKTACGTISYLLWGGLPALVWTKKILKWPR